MNELKTVNCEQLMTTSTNQPKTIPKRRQSLIEETLNLMIERKNFVGTATELSALLAPRFETEIFPNRLTRDLVQNAYELSSYGIKFSSERSHGARRIRLKLLSGDGSDSKNPVP